MNAWRENDQTCLRREKKKKTNLLRRGEREREREGRIERGRDTLKTDSLIPGIWSRGALRHPFLVFEWVSGGTLESINQNVIPENVCPPCSFLSLENGSLQCFLLTRSRVQSSLIQKGFLTSNHFAGYPM